MNLYKKLVKPEVFVECFSFQIDEYVFFTGLKRNKYSVNCSFFFGAKKSFLTFFTSFQFSEFETLALSA